MQSEVLIIKRRTGQFWLNAIYGLILSAIGISLTFLTLSLFAKADPLNLLALIIFCIVYSILGLFRLRMIFGSYITLSEKGIDLPALIGRRLLLWKEISAVRSSPPIRLTRSRRIWIKVNGSVNPTHPATSFFLQGYQTPSHLEMDLDVLFDKIKSFRNVKKR
jgi:hypothetical protein